jgi:membrane protease YdiL (CAAX protease family)
MSRAATANKAPASATPRRQPKNYFQRSELPLYSLVFLLPAVAFFEIAAELHHPSDPIAFRILQQMFEPFGAKGRLIPALCLISILLSWHIARKDAWQVRFETIWTMAFESWALSLPLLALGIAVARWNIHVPLYARPSAWRDELILSLGAGIYEELVFRLILMTALAIFFANILKVPTVWANLLMVCISAVLFSLYHYLGSESFELRNFVFRTIAGVYFAVIFLTRGFGITAGCHIFYDVIIVILQTGSVR